MKGLKRGQKGFTLFEVLIVVAILGVLAAIAAPIVSHFSVYGTVNAANTEADNVRTAASAYMVEHSGQWPASSEIEGVGSYLSGEPKAVYHFSNGEDGIKAGLIASAIPTESGWKDVQWDVTSQMWVAIGKPVVGLGDGVAVKGGGSSGGSEGGTGPELAQIEPTTYTLTVYIVGNGSVEPPLGSYEPGTEVQLTATPADNWTFSGWSGDLSGNANPTTITMDSDKTVTAIFTTSFPGSHYYWIEIGEGYPRGSYGETDPPLHNPITLAGTCGAIKFSGQLNQYQVQIVWGDGTVDDEVEFWPIQTGNDFTATWSGNHTYEVGDNFTITAKLYHGQPPGNESSGDAAAVAVVEVLPPVYYHLIMETVGLGTVSPGNGDYLEGNLTINATPAEGWTFSSWSTANMSSIVDPYSAETTLILSENKTVTATFTQDTYTLTVNTVGNGSVSLNPPGGSYSSGTSVNLTASADPGWTFDSWSGDLTGSTNPETITMDSNKTVTATFAEGEYTVSANISPSEAETAGCSVSGTGYYNYNDTVDLTANAATGWNFSSWSSSDITISNSTNPALSFSMPAHDVTVTAQYSQVTYTVTFDLGDHGTLTGGELVQTVAHGGAATAPTFDVEAGWTFTGWDTDFSNVTSDLTVTAQYSEVIILQAEPSRSHGQGPIYFVVDFEGKITTEPISSDGRLLNPLEAPSLDGNHLFEMEQDTLTLDENDRIIRLITIRQAEAPPLPEDTVVVGNAYNFQPSGITFDEPVRLTLGYDVNKLPENVASVVLAYYNSEAGWTELRTESDVVAGVGQLSASVDHFTIFAVLARVSPQPPTTLAAPPATFKLSNLSINPLVSRFWELLTFRIESGKEVTIAVDVINQGGQEGNFNAILTLNGVTRGTKDVTLVPGQSQRIVFNLTENDPGTYVVQLGDLSGEFTTSIWFNWWLTAGLAAAFILLCYIAWYYRKRIRKTS